MEKKRLMKFNKSLIGGITAFVTFFGLAGNVFAKMLSVDEISEKFPKTSIIEGFSQFTEEITSNVNSEDSTLDILVGGAKHNSFTYTSDYIEYNNRDGVITEENCGKNAFDVLLFSGVIESILNLSGYENITVSDDADLTNTFDTYGIQMEAEPYDFSGTDEMGDPYSLSGDYVKYFKVSLDTDKIKALVDKYGVPEEEAEDPNIPILKELKPKLEARDITANSVTIYPSIPNYTNTDPDYVTYCYIYRADSEDGSYEKISDMAVNCSGDVGVVDENLESNKTYFYKGKIIGSKLQDIGADFSIPIPVTTKNTITNTNANVDKRSSNTVENPKTGVNTPIVGTVVVGVIAIVTLAHLKKKSVL